MTITNGPYRNAWISCIFSAQGLIIIVLGIAAPYMISDLSWRWMYYITAFGAASFLVGVYLFTPETRWPRTRAEMSKLTPRMIFVGDANNGPKDGVPRSKIGHQRGPRTFRYNIALFYGKNVAPALLIAPWSWGFVNLSLCLVLVFIAAVAVALVAGSAADWVANRTAKKRGVRVPENQLVSLIIPALAGIIGPIFFGLSGSNQAQCPYFTFLTSLGAMAFGFLGANTIGAVYVLCYSHLASPALVNNALFRGLLAFMLSFNIFGWIVNMGYFNAMIIYAGSISACAIFVPVVYYYGPAWRKRWPAEHFSDHM
ncbi:major facilitator superfamily transporter [Colletotrichum orchidophilum]|uniref:Major facilitator superfamily transporter n=1 Tax=Colletotrichum orchidophilum TaxID=1209926 RepID=A0A1G4AQS5_9PEZI|nr:major facilitator superfamily transporter [Colletotrichum orchidophilum]OHE91372.1 major facilitator superfamily transporter [Colletotrichum orchidophilum]